MSSKGAMSEENDEKSALVPRRRFPEFRNAGEWERKALSEFLFEYQQRNRDLKYGPQDVLSVSGEFGCVNQIELLGRSYAGVSVKDYRVVEPGDIVYTKSPLKKNPFGIIKENKGKPGIVSTLYAIYRAKENAHPAYFDHYFSRDYFLNAYLQPLVKKGAKNDMKVNNSVVLSGDVIAPKKDEQQKIAACLSSIDELITAETQKLDALKTHKKGLMQQLFPREGETVPRLRFPEFREAPEWGKAMLQELVTTVSPPSKIQSSSYLPQGKFPIIDQSQEIICGWTNDESTVVTESLPLIVFGDHTCALKFAESPFAQGADGIKILKAKTAISAKFLFHSLNHRPLIMEDYKRHFSILKERVVFYPDIKSGEQQKIADCLSALDEFITAQSQRIYALKSHKKGLMQQLFPVLDGVPT